MYTNHFGLKQRPFGSNAVGARVFVGPQLVKTISSLGDALSSNDAIATVSGRVGIGKTTIVNRALETAAEKRVVARVGRLQLGPDEVLELLLGEFGVIDQPTGTIQRYSEFKRLLNEWAETDTRVYIVVEDVKHIGLDALLELEAMTAADAGDSPGANLLLMGPPGLQEYLAAPALDRVRQRLRRSEIIEPFDITETNGYLEHCFKVAGKETDELLEPGTAEMLYRLSEGIPRVVNNICETAFIAAAGLKMERLTPKFVETVALEVFSVKPKLPPLQSASLPNAVETEQRQTEVPPPVVEAEQPPAAPAVAAKPDPQRKEAPPLSEEAEQPLAASGPEIPNLVEDSNTGIHQLVVESGFAPNVNHSSDAGYVPEEADDEDELEIPEFIEDTRPALKELAALTGSLDAEPEPVPVPRIDLVEPDVAPTTELSAPEITAAAVPEIELPSEPSAPEIVAAAVPEVEPPSKPSAPEIAAAAVPEVEPPSKPSAPEIAAAAVPQGEPPSKPSAPETTAAAVPDVEAIAATAQPVEDLPAVESTQTQRTLILASEDDAEASEPARLNGTNAKSANGKCDPRDHVPEFDDIPTLSNSMRIKVPEVQARQAQPAAEPAQPAAEPAQPAPESAQKERAEVANLTITEPQAEVAVQQPPAPVEAMPQAMELVEPELPTVAASAAESEPETILPESVFEEKKEPASEAESDDDAAFEIDHELLAELQQEVGSEPPPAAKPGPAIKPAAAPAQTTSAGMPAEPPQDPSALAAALAAANEPNPKNTVAAPVQPMPEETVAEPVPELVLDKSLDDQRGTDVNIGECAAELGNAESLEDISDVMAETLFGNVEMQKIAAEFIEGQSSANEEPESPVKLDFPEKPQDRRSMAGSVLDRSSTTPVTNAPGGKQNATANAEHEPSTDEPFANLQLEIAPEEEQEPTPEALPPSMEVTLGKEPEAPPVIATDSIEDQIETEITASRLALNEQAIAKMRAEEKAEQEVDQKKNSGLFSLFKRASKN